jgi:DNA-binding NarL/FixJ family response regulator
MFKRPTVFVADDHSQFCEAITDSLRRDFDVVGTAHDAQAAVAKLSRVQPDLVVLDVSMMFLTALDVATRIRELSPSTLTMFVSFDPNVRAMTKAMKIGTLGYLVKSSTPSELSDVIWTLFEERKPANADEKPLQLTTREREVVQLLAQGKLMKQVADQLNVSTRTVAFHKYGVMRKLGLHSSAELVRMAIAQGLVA